MEPIKTQGNVFTSPQGIKMSEIFEEYAEKTDIASLGYDFEKNVWYARFKYPHRKYKFTTYKEFERICKKTQTNGNINYSEKATKKKI